MKRALIAFVLLIAGSTVAQQVQGTGGDVLGAHDLSPNGTAGAKGESSAACLYCHAPHSGAGKGPLWGQTLSSQVYSTYSSDTMQNISGQPILGDNSSLCLSCHDGTVAPGLSTVYGAAKMSGRMTSVISTKLETSHPFSLQLPMKDSPNLVSSLAGSGATADPLKAVKLVKGNIECTTCHNGHVQGIDPKSPNFLVRENSKGALCLACHETQPRTVNAHDNTLLTWPSGIHANSAAQIKVGSGPGGYGTVADAACISCHAPHNAGSTTDLLRNPVPPIANVDTNSQSCLVCHNGSDSLVVPIANVLADFQKKGHPFPAGTNGHVSNEPLVLNQNRHAACADCHNAHGSYKVDQFTPPPNLRPSQSNVTGVASDGSSITGPATRQFENCLRCHGASTGKQVLAVYGYLPTRVVFGGDPLNLISQFGLTAASSHPVMRDSTGQSQPSLLPAMWDLLGKTQMRPMGTRIFCTDCHNSERNREFGGDGPNGPHGSSNSHILERRYESSQTALGTFPNGGPGSLVTNLFPTPPLDPASGGPYSMCAKCHDLNIVNSNTSFAKHSTHIQKGLSCSVCHTAHGVPAGGNAGLTGQRLVNFDLNLVAPNAGVIAYSNNTCTLRCHMMDHNPDGSVTAVAVSSTTPQVSMSK